MCASVCDASSMRRQLLFRMEAALPALDHTQVLDARHAAARLGDDCGCAMGGIFLWAALLVGAPTLVATYGVRPLVFVVAAAAVVVGAALGKLVGIGIASLRLLMLVRRMEAASLPERGFWSVHLH